MPLPNNPKNFYLYFNKLGPFLVNFVQNEDTFNKELCAIIDYYHNLFKGVPVLTYDHESFNTLWKKKYSFNCNDILILKNSKIDQIHNKPDIESIEKLFIEIHEIRFEHNKKNVKEYNRNQNNYRRNLKKWRSRSKIKKDSQKTQEKQKSNHCSTENKK